MRTCSRCETSKPIHKFRVYFVKGRGYYRRRICNECMDAAATKWRNDNKDRLKEWWDKRYAKTRETRIERAKQWNKENKERQKRNYRSRYKKLRHAAILAYGGYRCNCCGETMEMFLSVDHVHNDGHKHRNGKGRFTGDAFYRWLKKNDYPEGFQVLCHNCNIGKHLNGGVCPHESKRVTTIREE